MGGAKGGVKDCLVLGVFFAPIATLRARVDLLNWRLGRGELAVKIA